MRGHSFPALMLAAVRSTLYALLFGAITVPLTLVALALSPFGAPAIGASARAWGRLQRFLMRVVLGQRIRIEGKIPDDTYFVVCKHESMFETIDSMCLFNLPVVVAKKELIDIPLWGWAAQRYGLIGIDRKAGAKALRAVRSQARHLFAQGRPILFYPEGTRVAHGEAPALRAGFAGLYAVLNCPVLPMAVDSGARLGWGGFLRLPGTITYRIGEIIPPGLPRAEAEARAYAAINALNPSVIAANG